MLISDGLWQDIKRYLIWRAARVGCEQAAAFLQVIEVEQALCRSCEHLPEHHNGHNGVPGHCTAPMYSLQDGEKYVTRFCTCTKFVQKLLDSPTEPR